MTLSAADPETRKQVSVAVRKPSHSLPVRRSVDRSDQTADQTLSHTVVSLALTGRQNENEAASKMDDVSVQGLAIDLRSRNEIRLTMKLMMMTE